MALDLARAKALATQARQRATIFVQDREQLKRTVRAHRRDLTMATAAGAVVVLPQQLRWEPTKRLGRRANRLLTTAAVLSSLAFVSRGPEPVTNSLELGNHILRATLGRAIWRHVANKPLRVALAVTTVVAVNAAERRAHTWIAEQPQLQQLELVGVRAYLQGRINAEDLSATDHWAHAQTVPSRAGRSHLDREQD
jgi:hypothetical protein